MRTDRIVQGQLRQAIDDQVEDLVENLLAGDESLAGAAVERGESRVVHRFSWTSHTTMVRRRTVQSVPERSASAAVLDRCWGPTMTDQTTPTTAAKRCPSCAEVVQRDARRCRFCGHSFGRRRFSPPWWFVVLAVAIITAVAVVAGFHIGGGDGGGGGLDTSAAEQQIAPSLERKLRHLTGDRRAQVVSVSCIAESRTEGHCVARVREAGDSEDIGIVLHADAHGGAFIWHVES